MGGGGCVTSSEPYDCNAGFAIGCRDGLWPRKRGVVRTRGRDVHQLLEDVRDRPGGVDACGVGALAPSSGIAGMGSLLPLALDQVRSSTVRLQRRRLRHLPVLSWAVFGTLT